MRDAVTTKILQLPTSKPKTAEPNDDSVFVPLPEELRLPEPNDYQFLRDVVTFSQKWSPRSPKASHEAIAIHTLCAAAAGRVVFDFGGRHRTTLYQFLVAPSTLYAKTTVASIATDLLDAAGLSRVNIGRATPQSFFDQCLEKVPTDYDALPDVKKDRIRERLQNAAQRAWYAEEFGTWAVSMLREGSVSYEFRSLLLNIYDSPNAVEMSTRTYGTLAMERPSLALFAVSTYADVQKIAAAGSPFWRDGLLARFDWITTEESETHSNDMFPAGRREVPRSVVEGLREYDQMLGRATVRVEPVVEKLKSGTNRTVRQDVVVTPQPEFVVELSSEVYDAAYSYDVWLRDTLSSRVCEDLRPSYGRMVNRTLRIACLLASYEKRRTVELRDFAKARAIVERRREFLHLTYRRLTDVAGEAERVQRTDRILQFVAANRTASLRDIQKKYQRNYPMGAAELRRELDALVSSGDLKCIQNRSNRTVYAVDVEALRELETTTSKSRNTT